MPASLFSEELERIVGLLLLPGTASIYMVAHSP
jgi:hypothetical protein